MPVLGLVLIGFLVLVFRYLESHLDWCQNRASTAVWTTLTTVIAVLMIVESESYLVAAVVAGITGYLVWAIWKGWRSGESDDGEDGDEAEGAPIGRRACWLWTLIVCVPVTGWILYGMRFPDFHGLPEPEF